MRLFKRAPGSSVSAADTAHARRRRQRPAPAFDVQPLEQRVLLSFAPAISGATTRPFGTGVMYRVVLSTTGNEATDSWTVNWGAGEGSSTLSRSDFPGGVVTNPVWMEHAYSNGPGVQSITATAKSTASSTVHNARPFALDSSFGDVHSTSGTTLRTGKAMLDPTTGVDQVYGMALQPDGKIVAAGVTSSHDFAVLRYTTDGALDPSFGNGAGRVSANVGGATATLDKAFDVVVQGDGKIVAVGISGGNFGIARFDPDGTLDTSFSGDGVDRSVDFGSADQATSVAIDAGGRIVVGGHGGTDLRFAVARYNTDGSLDSTFGDVTTTGRSGKTRRPDFAGRYFETCEALVIQPDGKLVLGGYADDNSGGTPNKGLDFALTRLNPDGTLDTTFGTGGYVTTDYNAERCCGPNGSDSDYALVLQPDGKIVAAGATETLTTDSCTGSQTSSYDFALVRYNANGSLDTTFGDVSGSARSGKTKVDFNGGVDYGYGVALQPDGRLVVAGTGGNGAGGTGDDFAVARLNPDGTLDTSFGGGGKITTDFAAGTDSARAVAVQPDGRIVLAGFAGNAFALARYLPGGQVAVSDAPLRIDGPDGVGEGGRLTLKADASGAAGSGTISYVWSVTLGGNPYLSSTGDTLEFRPEDDGRYDVSLTAMRSGWGPKTTMKTVTVTNVAPANVAVSGPAAAGTGRSVVLTGRATDPAGENDRLRYAWRVTKDSIPYPLPAGTVTDLPSLRFTPTAPGKYVATFSVTDDEPTSFGAGSTAAQMDTFTVGGEIEAGAAGDVFKITLSGAGGATSTLSVQASSSSREAAAAQIAAQFNASQDPLFARVTAAAMGPAVTLTADDAETPFYATVATMEADGGSPDAQAFSRTGTTGVTSASHALEVETLPAVSSVLTARLDDSGNNAWHTGNAVLIQPDGKVVVAGTLGTLVAGPSTPGGNQFFAARYVPTSSGLILDATFGVGGVVALNLKATSFRELKSGATDAALYPDGRILLVGSVHDIDRKRVAVARLNGDGSPDTTFGGGSGTRILNLGESQQDASGALTVELAGDDKIIIGGSSFRVNDAQEVNPHALLVRLADDGSLDTTFDGDGWVLRDNQMDWDRADNSGTPAPGDARKDLITDLAVQPDGSIVTVGYVFQTEYLGNLPEEEKTGVNDTVIMRYTASGALDTTFAPAVNDGVYYARGDGILYLDPSFASPGETWGSKIALQPDGKILFTARGGGRLILSRLHSDRDGDDAAIPDGTIDTSFGTNGTVIVSPASGGSGGGLALQADGGIVVGAQDATSAASMALLRYKNTGGPDTSFGTGSSHYQQIDLVSGAVWPVGDVAVGASAVAVVGESLNFDDVPTSYDAVVGLYRLDQGAASNLSATASPDGPIELRWLDSGFGEDGFGIERSLDGEDWLPLASVGSDVTQFTDTDVRPDTTYFYRMYGFNGDATQADGLREQPAPWPTANARTAPERTAFVLQDVVEVPITGTSVLSQVVLQKGKQYQLRATGSFKLGAGPTGHPEKRADAEYGRRYPVQQGGQPVPVWQDDNGRVNYGIGVRMQGEPEQTGLAKSPYWGPVSQTQDRAYTILFTAPADGKLEFDYHDDYYPDNVEDQGKLRVEIYRSLPGSPTHLTALPNRSSGRIKLSWRDTAGDETGFTITRRAAGGAVETYNVAPNVTTYDDTRDIVVGAVYTYTVTAYNGFGESTPSNEAAALLTPNRPPQVGLIPDLVARQGSQFRYHVRATDPDYVPGSTVVSGDADPSGMTYSLLAKPSAAMQIDAAGNIHNWTPVAADVGKRFPVTVRVHDADGMTVDRSFTVTVQTPSAVSPVITEHAPGILAPAIVVSGTTATLSAVAKNTSGQVDPSYTYTWSTAFMPGSADEPTFDGNNGTTAGSNTVATFNRHGKYYLRLTVADADGNFSTSDVEVVVKQVVSSVLIHPQFYVDSDNPQIRLSQNEAGSFTATTYDQFGMEFGVLDNNVTWTVPQGGGIAIEGPNGLPSVKVKAGTVPGAYTLGVRGSMTPSGTDPAMDPLTASVTVTVTSSNTPPEIDSGPHAVLVGPQRVQLSVRGRDGGGGEGNLKYTWSAEALSGGAATFDGPNTGDVVYATFSPSEDYRFHVTVTDGAGDSVSSFVDFTDDQRLTTITVTPASQRVATGATQQFTAVYKNQFGQPMEADPATKWWVDGVLTNETGETFTYTAPAEPRSGVIVRAEAPPEAPGDTPVTGTAVVRVAAAEGPVVRIDRPSAETRDENGAFIVDRDTGLYAVIDDPDMDPGNDLENYVLQAVPASGGPAITLLESDAGAAEVGSAPFSSAYLATISPTMLPSGTYTLTLTATDSAGMKGCDSIRINVRTFLKLGNFTLPQTDLVVPVPGAPPITVSRVYDSLDASTDGRDFGFGWRFDAVDVALRTTAEYVPGRSKFGITTPDGPLPAFRAADLVYVTLPGGAQHVFQFVPKPTTYDPMTGVEVNYWPQFVAVDGSLATLKAWVGTYAGPDLYRESEDGTGEIFDRITQKGYNPADPEFGGKYYLTTQDGTKYTIDAKKGWIQEIRYPNGGTLAFEGTRSDSPLAAASDFLIARDAGGSFLAQVMIHRTAGRIDWIAGGTQAGETSAAPDRRITFGYTGGDLTSVTDRAQATTSYDYYTDSELPPERVGRSLNHYLKAVTDARPVKILSIKYDEAGKVVELKDARANPAGLAAGGFDGDRAHGAVTDMNDDETEVVYDRHGNAVREVRAVKDPVTGLVAKYVVVVREYTYTLEEVDKIDAGVSNDNTLSRVTEWRPFEVTDRDATGQVDPYGRRFTRSPTLLARKLQFNTIDSSNPNQRGEKQLYSETVLDADGVERMTTYGDYDAQGRPRKVIDPDGNVTYSFYNSLGNLRYSVNALGEGTQYLYSEDVHPLAGLDGSGILAGTLLGQGLPGGLLMRTYRVANYLSWASWATDLEDPLPITAVDPTQKKFTVEGYKVEMFRIVGLTVRVAGAGANDKTYTVVSATLNGANTEVVVAETIPTDTVRGTLTPQRATRLEDPRPITAVNTAAKKFTVARDHVALFTYPGLQVRVEGSGGANDQVYTVVSATLNGGNTEVVVAEAIPTGTVAGTLAPQRPDNNTLYYGSTTANATTPGGVRGLVQSTTDAAGLTTLYTYNREGQVKQVSRQWVGQTTPVLDSLTDYDPSGRVIKVTDADGQFTETFYDALGRVSDTKDKYGGVTHSDYDLRGNLVRTLYPDETETRTTYDAMGRAAWTTTRYKSNTDFNQQTRQLLSNDDTTKAPTATRTVYDSLGRVVRTEQYRDVLIKFKLGVTPLETEVPADMGGHALISASTTEYDAAGRVRATTDAAGLRTVNSYYGNGQLHTTQHAVGSTISTTTQVYDPKYLEVLDVGAAVDVGDTFRVTMGIKRLDVTAASTSAEAVAVLIQNTINAETSGPFFSVKALAEGSSVRIVPKDAQSPSPFHITTSTTNTAAPTTAPDNQTLSRRSITQVIDAAGNATTTESDALGRSVRTTFPRIVGESLHTAVETLHGVGGQAVNRSDVSLPTSTEGWTGVPPGGQHVVKIEQRKVKDPAQPLLDGDPVVATHYLYDASGRLTDVWQPAVDDAETAATDSVRPHWRYGYDANGNQTSQTDPKGNTTTFGYDNHNRRTSRTLPGGTATTAERSFYDDFGRIRAQSDFIGNLTVYTYDDQHDDPALTNPELNLGRLVAQTTFAMAKVNSRLGAADWRASVTTTAGLNPVLTDADNYVLTAFGARLDFGYDTLGRQSSVRDRYDDDQNGTFDAGETDRATTYAYDRITGGVTQVASPEGTINYAYEQATGRLERTWTANNDTRYTHDKLGRLETVFVSKRNGVTPPSSERTVYTYDAVGNLNTVTLPNGVVSDYDYDELNRLDLLTVRDAQADKLFEQDYALLNNGQRDYVVERRYDGASATPFSKVKIDWAYDALGRLEEEVRDADPTPGDGTDNFGTQEGDDYTDAYSFDLSGNRVRKAHDEADPNKDAATAYTYNARDQLTGEGPDANADNIPDSVTTSYGYDDNGSMTSKATGSITSVYRWDLRGRMTGHDADSTDSYEDATYSYDHDGLRVSTTASSSGNTLFLLDNNSPTGYAQVLEEKESATAVPSRSYVIGQDVIAQATSTGPQYLLYDGHGSTRGLTDKGGLVVDANGAAAGNGLDYDAYGNPVGFPVNAAATLLLYAGEQMDPVTGMYNLRARHYDPRSGSFPSEDPFLGTIDNPATLHKYLYVHANPINGTDPTGMVADFTLGGLLMTVGTQAFLMSFALERLGYEREDWAFYESLKEIPIVGNIISFGENAYNGEFAAAFVDLGWLAFDIWGGVLVSKGIGLIGKSAGKLAKRAASAAAMELGAVLRQYCFTAGTRVVTSVAADGSLLTKDIEAIEVGDYVLARDQFDAQDGVERRRVVRTFVKTADHVRVVQFRDARGNVETIQTTDDHPFWVEGVGWLLAKDLLDGDQVDQPDGANAVVISSVREEHAAGITVYNFEVEGDHTYFVEDGTGQQTAIWVHNACAGVLGRALGGKAIMNALGYSAHHIVSHSHRGAASVRAHLRRLGFTAADLDKAYNGAWLKGGKGSYHAGLHTTKYFKELEKRLLPLGNKADVIDELGNIAWELMDGTFPH